jgi:hypothetical protein
MSLMIGKGLIQQFVCGLGANYRNELDFFENKQEKLETEKPRNEANHFKTFAITPFYTLRMES